MKKILKTAHIVRVMLEHDPASRDDDNLLWALVLEYWATIKGYMNYTREMNIGGFLRMSKQIGAPSFETVSRLRRKEQEKNPALRGTKRTQAARAEQEKKFREYAKKY